MASTTAYQPFLNTPKTTLSSCKTLSLVFSLSILLICSAIFLVPNVKEPDQHDTFASRSLIPLHRSLKSYVQQMHAATQVANNMKQQANGHKDQAALADCLELMDLSIDRVTDSIQALANWTARSHADAQAWLSGVLTNHDTCLDGLHELGIQSFMDKVLQDLISRGKALLAVVNSNTLHVSDEEIIMPLEGSLPSWLLLRDRRLLEISGEKMNADAVVAQDGSGNYVTVADAIASAPNKSESRYVIYVKKGTYEENVEVGKKKKNVMIVGDGMDKTIITGSLNYVDGTSTFRTATLAAVGDGFILQDICIQNTAGPEKHQAVALRVGADQSVINRCRIDAYQDTLYTHSLRQFYRDCYITGTIDFIFGNAAVVFQNSKLVARKPMSNQKNMVTAQGRIDPNQNTGTSIQNCEIIASPDLEPVQDSFKTYLGRPWKNYSRTVVMQSHIGDLIDPAGWSEWSGDFALETLYYGEYMNRGGGAGTSKRVKWPGYHVITEAAEAMNFTVRELIQGGVWLKSTGVAFTEGLLN